MNHLELSFTSQDINSKDLSIYSSDQIEEGYGVDVSWLREKPNILVFILPLNVLKSGMFPGHNLQNRGGMLWGKSFNDCYNSPSSLSAEVIV